MVNSIALHGSAAAIVCAAIACAPPGHGQHQQPRSAHRSCDTAKGLNVAGDLETIYGRLVRTVTRAYDSARPDPLTRTVSTGWHRVPEEHRHTSGEGCILRDVIANFDMRFTVRLEGQSPLRVRVDSETRMRVTYADSGEPKRQQHLSSTLEQFEDQLRETIRTDLSEFAANCDGTMVSARCDPKPRGAPHDFAAPPVSEGIDITGPKLCEGGAGTIRISRDRGSRILGVKRKHGTTGAIGDGCRHLPDAANPCPTLSVIPVLHEIFTRIRRSGITVGGIGMGPCGSATGTYEVLDMSVKVLDWRDAAEATRIAAEVLEAHDLRGYLGISVYGAACATLL